MKAAYHQHLQTCATTQDAVKTPTIKTVTLLKCVTREHRWTHTQNKERLTVVISKRSGKLPCHKITDKTWLTTWMLFSCAYPAKLIPGENKRTKKPTNSWKSCFPQHVAGWEDRVLGRTWQHLRSTERFSFESWSPYTSGEGNLPDLTRMWDLLLLFHLNIFKAIAKGGKVQTWELEFSEVSQVEDLRQLEKKKVSSFHVPPPSSYLSLST